MGYHCAQKAVGLELRRRTVDNGQVNRRFAFLVLGCTACSFTASTGTSDSPTTKKDAGTDGRLVDATLVDGRLDAAGLQRTKAGLIARYDFNETVVTAAGTTINDVSGQTPAANLVSIGSIALNGTSLRTAGAVALIDASNNNLAGKRITDACKQSNELTVEAWIKHDDLTITSRYVTLTSDADIRDNNFFGLNSNTRVQGTVRLSQGDTFGQGIEDLNGVVAATKQLVVFRYGSGTFKLDVYGENNRVIHQTRALAGNFNAWSNNAKFVVLNTSRYFDPTDARPFSGEIFSLAIYCRNLTDAEVTNDMMLGSESP